MTFLPFLVVTLFGAPPPEVDCSIPHALDSAKPVPCADSHHVVIPAVVLTALNTRSRKLDEAIARIDELEAQVKGLEGLAEIVKHRTDADLKACQTHVANCEASRVPPSCSGPWLPAGVGLGLGVLGTWLVCR